MKRLNNEGERIAPCGTPLYKGIDLDLVFLWVTLACLPEMKFMSHFLSLLCRFVSRILLERMCLGTVSKALFTSIATITVRSGLVW